MIPACVYAHHMYGEGHWFSGILLLTCVAYQLMSRLMHMSITLRFLLIMLLLKLLLNEQIHDCVYTSLIIFQCMSAIKITACVGGE